ncbi:Glycosyltransferase involved in cell wall bisynthesis [Kytococcus aerolatus]|uniref:D-inositol 3-phosphate glycosyltransferase n=1 Tax=Kytococcus aerolatus TaxID=592308 RepID=A0A212THN3_9MICO|nr:glycosyltransferase [Kytococcus aerolatus]SNC65341.1 Glycosyltransferase involved in cell wall bisynthesis [Kytococcus aerolatus]
MPSLNPAALRGHAKAAARSAVQHLPVRPVASLPQAGGSVGQRVLLYRAHHELKDNAAPDRALAVLDAVDPASLNPKGHSMRASALAALGRHDEAVAAAEHSTRGDQPDAGALGRHLQLLDRLGVDTGRRELLEKATRVKATNKTDAARLMKTFRTPDQELTQRFLDNVRTWPISTDSTSMVQVRRDSILMVHQDEDEIRDIARDLATTGPDGLAVAVSLLTHLGDFEELRRMMEFHRCEQQDFPTRPVMWAAKAALRAGHLRAAEVLAGRAISHRRGQKDARAIHRTASDQLAVVDHGWPVYEARPEPAYEPRPRAVLSVLAQSLPHQSGGYATRSHGVITGLRDLGWDMEAVTRLGFPYDRWSPKSKTYVAPVDVVDGIAYHRLLEPGERVYDNTPLASYINRFADRIAEHAVRHRASLIHASSFQNNGLAGLQAARRLGIPFVYEMRGLEDLMKVSRRPNFEQTESYAYMTELENHIVRNADLTFVITEALREEMIRRGGPADRIVVLPNGVHTANFEPRGRDVELAAELGVEGKVVIGYAGGLVDYEGIELILRAADELRRERDDFHVIIVGDGHHQARLHGLAAELELGDVVTFTGRVPHSEVPRYLSLFDITPFTRLPLPVCELISPIKPFESMAMGKAVISSSVAALTEIVAPDERGLVFEKGSAEDLASCLRRYLDSPELRQQMGRQAREWVLEHRDWSDVVTIADDAYHRVLGRD